MTAMTGMTVTFAAVKLLSSQVRSTNDVMPITSDAGMMRMTAMTAFFAATGSSVRPKNEVRSLGSFGC